jgi:hypothetical protein
MIVAQAIMGFLLAILFARPVNTEEGKKFLTGGIFFNEWSRVSSIGPNAGLWMSR